MPTSVLSLNKPSVQNFVTSTCTEIDREDNQTHRKKSVCKSMLCSILFSIKRCNFFFHLVHTFKSEEPIMNQIIFLSFLNSRCDIYYSAAIPTLRDSLVLPLPKQHTLLCIQPCVQPEDLWVLHTQLRPKVCLPLCPSLGAWSEPWGHEYCSQPWAIFYLHWLIELIKQSINIQHAMAQ